MTADVVQKSWPKDQQPPHKSLFGKPPPSEEQQEEWRLPLAINQDKPAWNEEICDDIYSSDTWWADTDLLSVTDLKPQDGGRVLRLCPVESKQPTSQTYREQESHRPGGEVRKNRETD